MSIKGILLSITGGILLLLSAIPLFWMGQEVILERKVQQEFSIDRIYVNFLEIGKVEILGKGASIPLDHISIRNRITSGSESWELLSMDEYNRYLQSAGKEGFQYSREYSWGNNTIQIEDQIAPGEHHSNRRTSSQLKIMINQTDWTVQNPVEVRPNELDENRYHGYFGLLTMKQDRSEQLVLVQRVSDIGNFNERDLAWRILTITANGQVKEERFGYAERVDDPRRTKFIQLSSTSPISFGYRSNILHVWPSLWFPFLYPWTTGVLGILFLIAGGILFWAGRRRNKAI